MQRINFHIFLISLISLNILNISPIKSETWNFYTKMRLCLDDNYKRVLGGFEKCMNGEGKKFWIERKQGCLGGGVNCRRMNEDEKKAEKKRKEKWDASEKERLLRNKYKNGNYHKYPQKLSINEIKNRNGIYKKDLIESYSFNRNSKYKVQYGDKVKINYIGTLENGKVFENSYEGRKKNISFKIGQGREIEGLHRGILGMRLGGIREIVIPPELGYGKKGKGKIIPPNSTLFYIVELIKVESENLLKHQKEYYFVSPPPKKIEWK